MEWIRSKIGMPAAAGGDDQKPRRQQPAGAQPTAEDAAALLRTQQTQLRMMQQEVAHLTAVAQAAAARGDRRGCQDALQRKQVVETDAGLLRGKIQNQERALAVLRTAEANRDQALVLQAGADRLDAIVAEAEAIDVGGLRSRYAESGGTVNEMSRELSEPMFGDGSLADEGDVDHAVEAMMRQAAGQPVAAATPLPALPDAPKGRPQQSVRQRVENRGQ
jgi:hypothetical protein